VIWKLRHQGVLSDIGQLNSLLDVAKQYLITSGGWDLLQFATEMKSLTGGNLTFQTLPIKSYATVTVGGQSQSVNTVNPAAIKSIVHNAFYPAPTSAAPPVQSPSQKPAAERAPGATTVDVDNGGYTHGLAGQLSQALTSAGYQAGLVGNIPKQSSTQVLYGTGAGASASKIAGAFSGVSATASPSVAADHVKVLLGSDATSVPSGIGSSSPPSSSSSSASPSSTTSSAPAAPPGNGANGGAVGVKANAPYGIPCVY
jgi:hypothetical protein